jgi:hypothetical protein
LGSLPRIRVDPEVRPKNHDQHGNGNPSHSVLL